MLDSLRFVQGAVAKKDFVPALTHFRIAGGYILGYNGMLALHSPVALDLKASPKAAQLVKAVQTCKETIQLHMTTNGRLAVRSGSFRAFVDCTQEEFPDVVPEGQVVPLNGHLLEVMKKLAPIISDDASRSWSRGILLRGESAFATNNMVLVEYWCGEPFPVTVNIPKAAVTELLRIGEEPESLQLSDTSVTFHFSEGRWLRTQTFSPDWPDLSKILDGAHTLSPLPPRLWEALAELAPFTDELGRVYFSDGVLTTSLSGETGAVAEISDFAAAGCFNIDHLRLLEGLATMADFTLFPKACPFSGSKLRGAIVGMRS